MSVVIEKQKRFPSTFISLSLVLMITRLEGHLWCAPFTFTETSPMPAIVADFIVSRTNGKTIGIECTLVPFEGGPTFSLGFRFLGPLPFDRPPRTLDFIGLRCAA